MSEYKPYDKERNIELFDDLYFAHVNAMTAENLHSKAAIEAELAARDAAIKALFGRVKELEALINERNKDLKTLCTDIQKHSGYQCNASNHNSICADCPQNYLIDLPKDTKE